MPVCLAFGASSGDSVQGEAWRHRGSGATGRRLLQSLGLEPTAAVPRPYTGTGQAPAAASWPIAGLRPERCPIESSSALRCTVHAESGPLRQWGHETMSRHSRLPVTQSSTEAVMSHPLVTRIGRLPGPALPGVEDGLGGRSGHPSSPAFHGPADPSARRPSIASGSPFRAPARQRTSGRSTPAGDPRHEWSA
jgi:hypothetical protein